MEENYLKLKQERLMYVLPLVVDINNPTPSIGWDNLERPSFFDRCETDTIVALALLHHLAIGNNIPFEMMADFLSTKCKKLIIEFVPKDDSDAQRLLVSREDIFQGYNIENFEEEFGKHFKIKLKRRLKNSSRVIYLMTKKR